MARRRIKTAAVAPVTSFPGLRPKGVDKPIPEMTRVKAWIPEKKPPQPLPETKINVDEALAWIASCDRPDCCDSLGPCWQLVRDQLTALEEQTDKGAVKELPNATANMSFNGAGLAGQIRAAGKEDVPALQKLYAAMRLRYRHAQWLARRG